MKKRFFSLTVLLITAFVIIGGCGKQLSKEEIIEYINNDSLPIEEVRVSYAFDVSKLANKVGGSDYVFIGEVKDYIRTEYGFFDETPRTFYSVRVVENIKGELIQDQDIELRKTGGIDKKGKKFILYDYDYLPKLNNYYIFSVLTQSNGGIEASGKNSSILIKDKENYQDSEEYKNIIDAYLNQNEDIIDREKEQSKYDKNYGKQ
ncbi:MAG TPA: hypothetical protein GX745_00015 [Clostridiales bacterium]|jgi:hypothetical protein|nr:hypothetical protein [Clostridiales bacterium]